MTNQERFNHTWDYLTENLIATEAELHLVTSVAGTSIITLEAVLFSRTGYDTIEQFEEFELNM